MKLIWPLFGLPNKYSYLLLAEFSVRTVNYEPSFFKSMEKNEDS